MAHQFALSTHYDSLGILLEELKNHLEIGDSSILQQRIETAIEVHRQIQIDLDGVLADCRAMAKEFVELKDQQTKVAVDSFKSIIHRYETIHRAGGSAKLIYKVAKMENVDQIDRLKLLRTLFGFSLSEAQAISSEAEHELTP